MGMLSSPFAAPNALQLPPDELESRELQIEMMYELQNIRPKLGQIIIEHLHVRAGSVIMQRNGKQQ